jgi:predicted transcriptional regulator
LQISEDRRKQVIDLYFNQHKTYAEIAQIERISPRDISAIIKEEETRRQKHKQQEISSKAYKLFSEGRTPVEVAIIINLREPEVTKLYRGYWKLKGLDKLNIIHKETKGKLWPVWKLY